MVGAALAVLAAAGSPFLLPIATRPHPQTIATALLLGAMATAASFRRREKLGTLFVCALLLGLASAEFAPYSLFVPPFAFWWLVQLGRRGMWSWRAGFYSALCFAVTASLLAVSCWRYSQSEAAAWREFHGFFHVTHITLADQWHEVRQALPRQGWLLVLLFSVAPGVVVFMQMLEEKLDVLSDIGRKLLLWAVVFIAIAQAAELPGSLARVAEGNDLAVVALFMSAWLGRLAGGLLIALGPRGEAARQPLSPRRFFIRIAIPAAAFLGFATDIAVNAPRVRTDDGQARWRFADDMIANLQGRRWMVTDGSVDTLAKISARRRGVDVVLLNAARTDARAYLKFVSASLPNTRLRALAFAGLQPVLDEWLRSDSNACRQIAVQHFPDLLMTHNSMCVPSGPIFLGVPVDSAPPAKELWNAQREYFSSRSKAPAWPEQLRSCLAKSATDTGVILAMRNDAADALAAFEMALRFNSNNVSARLNIASLSTGEMRRAEVSMVEKIVARPDIPRRLAALSFHDGWLLEVKPWLDRGWKWAVAGAMERGPDLEMAAVRARIVALEKLLATDFRNDDPSGAHDHAGQLLRIDPNNPLANYGIGTLYFSEARFDLAEASLRASIASRPSPFAWADLARTLLAAGRDEDALAAADAALAMSDRQASAWRVRGEILLKREQFTAARKALQSALSCDPTDRVVLHDLRAAEERSRNRVDPVRAEN
jgi:tetratricopeptide (TPR) repeat protein